MKKAAQATVNQRLISERKKHGWLQQEVADRVGTTRVTISRWEQGITLPSSYFRQQLCSLFEKCVEELGLLVDVAGKEQPDGAPLSIWNLPYQRNLFFTGRDEFLVHFYHTLHPSKTMIPTQIQVISGLGGIGKTQTVVEYAYRYRDNYHAILWVQADTPEALTTGFVALADALNLRCKDEQNQYDLIQAVKRWLKNSIGWLLIFDNVQDFATVSDMILLEGRGHIVLTTRTQFMGTFANCIELGQMKLDEATLLLLRRAKIIDQDASLEDISEIVYVQAKAIAVQLNGFPLALDQVGAYIEETGCNLSEYFNRYQIRRGTLLDRRGSSVTAHPESVGTTLFLLIKKVEQISFAAAEVLRLCAFLAADAIPEEILFELRTDSHSILQPVIVDFIALDEVVAILRTHFLLQRNNNMKTFSVHRLVQVIIKEKMDESMQRQWAEHTVCAVNQAFLGDKTFISSPRCQLYLAHVKACIELIEEWNIVFAEAAQLLYKAGIYLKEHTQDMQAEKLLRKAKEIYIASEAQRDRKSTISDRLY